MKFELEVGQGADESSPIKIRFSLRKNSDGSVGLLIHNSGMDTKDTNVELFRITTSGVIKRWPFSAVREATSFMQYDYSNGSNYVRFE